MTQPPTLTLHLPDAEATARLGQTMAGMLGPGDTVLLHGPIGAGKSHLARALIRARLGRPGEEVPSPSFTLVQAYPHPGGDLWHADLYRLTHPDELAELGLDAAFDTAICLVEWPDRLGRLAPENALHLALSLSGVGRQADLRGGRPGLVAAVATRWSAP